MNNKVVGQIVYTSHGPVPTEVDFDDVKIIEIRHVPLYNKNGSFKKFHQLVSLRTKSDDKIRLLSTSSIIKRDIKQLSGSMKTVYSYTHEIRKKNRVVKATDRDIEIQFLAG